MDALAVRYPPVRRLAVMRVPVDKWAKFLRYITAKMAHPVEWTWASQDGVLGVRWMEIFWCSESAKGAN